MLSEDTNEQSHIADVRAEASNIRSMLAMHGENRIKQWFLLRGDRWKVAVALMLGVLFALLLLTRVQSIELRNLLTNTNTIQTLFNTLLSGIILLVSIVVSINSVFLSQEITDIESQQQRVDATVDYRNRIEEFIDTDVSPARPAEFLRVVLGTINQQATVLADRAADSDNEAFGEEAADFRERVTEDTKNAAETLEDAQFGTFNVLLAGLNYDYSWQLHVARRFKRKYHEALTDSENEAIDDLADTLKFFAVGREYFKSLYYKRELARLSSRLLYVALPTLVFTSYVLLALDSKLFPEMSLFGISPLVLFVSIAYTLALGPYLIFTAYVIRAATVTQRTLSAGPFVLQRGTDVGGLDWDGTVESIDWNLPEGGSETESGHGTSGSETPSENRETGPTPEAEVQVERESEADD